MMELFNYINLNNKRDDGRNLWGLPSGTSQADRIFFEHIWKRHPGIKNIIELGTWYGVTALYFGMLCRIRNGWIKTFDIVDVRIPEVKQAWLDTMTFLEKDVLNEDVVEQTINSDTLLFIDNGNKTKEVLKYARYVLVGGMIIVHDWQVEVDKPCVLDNLWKLGFNEVYCDIAEMVGSSARCFIRRDVA